VLFEQAVVLRKLKKDGFMIWLAGASLSLAGCGIWAMHFTGMNALTLPVEVTYNATMVVVSSPFNLLHFADL
jgi:NO-binding membrane sensor protein with MHYT domain